MKSVISKLLLSFVVVVLVASCASSDLSLQKYYIDNKDNKNFLSVDIPASIISLQENAGADVVDAYNSLKKLNVLAFKKDQSNEAEYQVERKKVKAILKSGKYAELMRVKDKGVNFVVKYEGDEETESFDEVVVYASDKTKGFALVRVLGNDMTPDKFMKLVSAVKDVDTSNGSFKELEGFLKGISGAKFENN